MKDDPKTSLYIRNFPESLKLKCKAKAALQRETLEKFVEGVLRKATTDIPEPKAK
jgi:plasmid stability protein